MKNKKYFFPIGPNTLKIEGERGKEVERKTRREIGKKRKKTSSHLRGRYLLPISEKNIKKKENFK